MIKVIKQGLPVELKTTGDGSHTLFVPGLNEHYHSVFGAIAESRHIFIEAGLKFVSNESEKVRILEIGFGTGLNLFLTLIESKALKFRVEYTAIELNLLNEEIYSRLNYAEILNYPDSHNVFIKLHDCPWNIRNHLSKNFSLLKIDTSIETFQPENEAFDLIYYDAFGPDVQPGMWTKDVFNKMAFGLKKQGVLVTYSTKGTVKRNLKEAGFSIEKLQGPVGKREILRAIKI